MFNNLKNRFQEIFTSIGKNPSINEEDLTKVLREIRLVLLEADVALQVAKSLIEQIKEDLLGREIYRSISPKIVITKAVYDALFNLLNEDEISTKLHTKALSYYMMVGLQGSGKTTTCAKIANFLKIKENKKVLMCCLDLHRPAAYNQLQSLATSNGLDFFTYDYESYKSDLFKILQEVDIYAKQNNYDVVILDTAGRLSIDEALMSELGEIYKKINPKEVLLVIDSASGQIALDVAKSFNEKVALSGIIASKVDADSRGGAIISCKYITNIPIKFMGMGEKINNLEIFNAKKIVDRVLSQGDILTLVEKFDEIEEVEAQKLKENLEKGIFSLDDLKKQILQMKKLGGITSLISMIPGVADKLGDTTLAEKNIKKQVAIIDSMTKRERMYPKILNFSRKKRIAKGSGTELSDINKLLKQYEQMAKMIKQFKNGGGGMMNMMKQLKNMGAGGNLEDMFKKLK